MSTSNSATTTTMTFANGLGPSSSSREYNHAMYGSHLPPSVGNTLHYALPHQSQPRSIIPSNNDPGPSASHQEQQQQEQEQQMFRSQDLSQQESRLVVKRKQLDLPEDKASKKRKPSTTSVVMDGDDSSSGDSHGAKHWTDDEKTKFFLWLLGSDEHWETFRTKMNTCFRECAQTIFGGKKTFTALKSCYHRNLETFKQLSAFERFCTGSIEAGLIDPNDQNERQVHFEKRLESARGAGCLIGPLSPRVVDSWLRHGWFDLFKNRLNEESNRPLVAMHSVTHADNPIGDAEHDDRTDQSPEPTVRLPSQSPNFSNTGVGPTHRQSMMPPPLPSITNHPNFQSVNALMRPPSPSTDQTVAHLSVLTQNLITTFSHMVRTQSEDSRLKLGFMKRREEREEEDSRLRRELDRRREEREIVDWESSREREQMKQKIDLATKLVSCSDIDPSLKQTAGDYLKQIFTL